MRVLAVFMLWISVGVAGITVTSGPSCSFAGISILGSSVSVGAVPAYCSANGLIPFAINSIPMIDFFSYMFQSICTSYSIISMPTIVLGFSPVGTTCTLAQYVPNASAFLPLVTGSDVCSSLAYAVCTQSTLPPPQSSITTLTTVQLLTTMISSTISLTATGTFNSISVSTIVVLQTTTLTQTTTFQTTYTQSFISFSSRTSLVTTSVDSETTLILTTETETTLTIATLDTATVTTTTFSTMSFTGSSTATEEQTETTCPPPDPTETPTIITTTTESIVLPTSTARTFSTSTLSTTFTETDTAYTCGTTSTLKTSSSTQCPPNVNCQFKCRKWDNLAICKDKRVSYTLVIGQQAVTWTEARCVCAQLGGMVAGLVKEEWDSACGLTSGCLGYGAPAWILPHSKSDAGTCAVVIGGQGVKVLTKEECGMGRFPVLCRVWPDFQKK